MHVNLKNIKRKVGCSLCNFFIEICSLILYMLLQKSTKKCCFRIQWHYMIIHFLEWVNIIIKLKHMRTSLQIFQNIVHSMQFGQFLPLCILDHYPRYCWCSTPIFLSFLFQIYLIRFQMPASTYSGRQSQLGLNAWLAGSARN